MQQTLCYHYSTPDSEDYRRDRGSFLKKAKLRFRFFNIYYDVKSVTLRREICYPTT